MFVFTIRNKNSEWSALNTYLGTGPLPFVPLVEAVREPFIASEKRTARSLPAEMERLGGRLSAVADQGPVWFDLGHLVGHFTPKDVGTAHAFVRGGAGLIASAIVPTVRHDSPSQVIEAARDWHAGTGSGVCVRVMGVTRLDEKRRALAGVISQLGIEPGAIDFVVDAQDLPRAESHDALRSAFPIHALARTWVVLAGVFPSKVGPLNPKQYEHPIDRDEWLAWREECELPGPGRRPLYGDFGTQASVYTPSPQRPGSPTVRYTTEEQYVVLRGRGVTDLAQYIGHARYLRAQGYYGSLLTTTGDRYVERIAVGPRSGSRTTWRTASLQRHVELVAVQVTEFAKSH